MRIYDLELERCLNRRKWGMLQEKKEDAASRESIIRWFDATSVRMRAWGTVRDSTDYV